MEIRTPVRVSRSFTQHLVAPAAAVFPLLCPVRETEWIEGWDPISVSSASGVAEADCVFVTPSEPCDAVWYVSRHEPEVGFVEMIRVTPEETALRLTISLTQTAEGCDAVVTYTHTSLGPAGDEFVAAFTKDHYIAFMRDWERRLNHYLSTGQMLHDGVSR